MNLKDTINRKIYKDSIHNFELNRKCIINTLNAHSYCIAKKDEEFANALLSSDILLPDGVSIVVAARVLSNESIIKIAGEDIHNILLEKASLEDKKIFYLGASKTTLDKIEQKIKLQFSNVEIGTFSPPFKPVFSNQDSDKMIDIVNQFNPDILFVGMTAPKQEKWVNLHKDRLNSNVIVSIGAVFDFYAENINRAPEWMIDLGFEWFYRLIKEPKRMWKRYLINNTMFLFYMFKEKLIKI